MAFYPSISVLTSVYQGDDYLTQFFLNLRNQTIFPELELVLVLNEPSADEKKVAKDFQLRAPDQVQILFAHDRETLGSSWNRAWKASRAPYVTMWNVDDRRVVDSLQRQLSAMEENPEWSLCYGDYLTVSEYGKEQGIHRFTLPYKLANFRRYFAQGGAFWLFKKSISGIIGFFDEQFMVGPDMDLSLRMAVRGLEMGKCDGLLGHFTDASVGLSTRDGAHRSAIERTVIQLRYGVFDKVNYELLEQTKEYRVDSIKQSTSWIPLSTYLPDLNSYISSRKPLWILGVIRIWFRAAMKRLGLLDYLHRAQNKYLKREI